MGLQDVPLVAGVSLIVLIIQLIHTIGEKTIKTMSCMDHFYFLLLHAIIKIGLSWSRLGHHINGCYQIPISIHPPLGWTDIMTLP